MKEIIFITGNEKKYVVAKKYFEGLDISLVRKDMYCPEIQHMDVVEVVKFSVKFMAEKIGKPVIKSDNGFYIESLNGFPGTYMKDVEKTIGKEGFKKIMEGIENRKAKFIDALAFCEPGKAPIVFVGEIKGKLTEEVTDHECKLLDGHGASDMRFASEKGMPSVTFGPWGENYHGDGEFIYIKSLELFYKVMNKFIETFIN